MAFRIRRPLSQSLATALLLAACAPPDSFESSAPTPGEAAARQQPEFVLGPDTNICFSLTMDQRVWSQPLAPDANHDFTNWLMGEVLYLLNQQGIPYADTNTRFHNNQTGTNPFCQGDGHIFVTVRYLPNEQSRPLRFDYSIRQGTAERSATSSRDIEAEWRASGRGPIAKFDSMAFAIADDIRSRAAIFADVFEPLIKAKAEREE